jgi:hypothetical protein
MGTVSLNVFPNPFSTQSKITFSNPLNEKFIISVYDYTGAVCSKLVTTEGELVISKNNMATGMYLIELINEKTGNRMHGKLLVSD